MTSTTTMQPPVEQASWLKRAGLFGFWFFFIKGLFWLAAPFAFYFLR